MHILSGIVMLPNDTESMKLTPQNEGLEFTETIELLKRKKKASEALCVYHPFLNAAHSPTPHAPLPGWLCFKLHLDAILLPSLPHLTSPVTVHLKFRPVWILTDLKFHVFWTKTETQTRVEGCPEISETSP